MEVNLINNDNNFNEKEKKLYFEVKKMRYIKYINLFFAIIRFILMFFLLSLYLYNPYSSYYVPSHFLSFLETFIILFLPIFNASNLITLIMGIINRNFNINNSNKLVEIACFFCCFSCCICTTICSKNVTTLKFLTLFF